jgi:hypothetical protein
MMRWSVDDLDFTSMNIVGTDLDACRSLSQAALQGLFVCFRSPETAAMVDASGSSHEASFSTSLLNNAQRQIAAAAWNDHRKEIEKLYVEDDCSLKQLSQYFKEEYGFNPT